MIVRVKRRRRFVVLSVETVEDARLSWEALGIWTYLMSKPDGWEVSSRSLARERKAGHDKVLRILKELEQVGLLWRERYHDQQSGQFAWRSILYETPQLNPSYQQLKPQISQNLDQVNSPCSENPGMVNLPYRDLPDMGLPDMGLPYLVNPDESNTDSAKTESTKTESTKKLEEEEAMPGSDHLFAHLAGLMQKNIGLVSPLQYEDMKATIDDLRAAGGDVSWIEQAVKIALDRNKRSWAYIRTVLDNAIKAGVPPDEYGRRLAERYDQSRQVRKGQKKTTSVDYHPAQLLDLTEVYANELKLEERTESGGEPDSGGAAQASSGKAPDGIGDGGSAPWF